MDKARSLRETLDGRNAVVFDFDNIIVDSEPYHFEAYSRVFSKRGHKLERDEYWLEWTSRGGGAEGEIKRHGLEMDPREIRREKDPIYSQFCRSGAVAPFPEAIEVIELLSDNGYILAIASGSYERDIRGILSTHGIEDRFRAVVGKDEITNSKPHPETYLRAAENIGLDPRECLAVEDAEKGIESGRAAGMKVIVIETPITRSFDLRGADLKLENMAEFSRLLREILPKEQS